MTTATQITGSVAVKMIAALNQFICLNSNFSMRAAQVFLVIAGTQRDLSARRLAGITGIQDQHIRSHLRSLVDQGLIGKRSDPFVRNGRQLFFLTPSGELLYQRIQECFQ